jgi:chromosome segregation ATPase
VLRLADKFGLRLGVENEAGFKQALRDINQSFKVLGSEMQLVTAQFDKNDKSIQAVTARNATLNKEVEAQREKVTTLKAALENAASSFGENDKRTQNWQIALNKAQAELIGMERELKGNTDLLGKLSKEEEAAGKASGDMGEGTKRAHASFADLGGLLKGNVTQSITSVKDGIADTAHKVVDGAKDMGSSIVQFAKDTVSGENNVKALGDALREKLEARLHGTAEEADDAADSMEDLGDSVDDAAKESEKAGSRFENLGETLKTAGKVIAGVVSSVGAACGAVGTAMFKMADSAAETGREVNNMSQKLGLSREGYRLLLTGTPVTNKALDIFSQYKFLNPEIFGRSFYAFRNRYFDMTG